MHYSFFKKSLLLLSFLLSVFCLNAQDLSRKNIKIPDIPGYITLKCDFHIHTVFSDGLVWPTVRVEEAWREGLDAIAITEHIEYRPNIEDIPGDHNRSYDIAKPFADEKGIILVKAAEITRGMPPGHLNALFINDANKLDQEDFMTVMEETARQDAFVFWNHPGWKAQQPDTMNWFDVHTQLLEKGWLHGIEIVNFHEYYPQAINWCIDKKLTMIANSDIHDPVKMEYDYANGDRRPLTLVFAKDRSEKAIKEALKTRMTALLFDDLIIGEEQILKDLFHSCVEIKKPEIWFEDGDWDKILITNHSELKIKIKGHSSSTGINIPKDVSLMPESTHEFWFKKNSELSSEIKVQIQVVNFQTGASNFLTTEL
ncbi:MAG: histidinol-phosphatase [Bacteroidales bacterium]|nr:histidinol-phosphatase [Bacteroidales bacterium]